MFRIDANGSETVLHSFAGQPLNGAIPTGLVRDVEGNLYGATTAGGTFNRSGFQARSQRKRTVVYNFGTTPGDGASPYGSPIRDRAGQSLWDRLQWRHRVGRMRFRRRMRHRIQARALTHLQLTP